MKEISKYQRDLIKSGHAITDSNDFCAFYNELFQFLSNKIEDEPIHIELLDIWNNNKKYLEPKNWPKGIRLSEEATKNMEKMLKASVHFDNIENIEINDNTKIAFLLGAGASAPSNIPTVNLLLPELWKRAKKIGREDLDNLARFCEERGIENIEDLLTAAYISNFAVKNSNINSLLGYFLMREEQLARSSFKASQIDSSSISFLQDTLQTLFGLLASTMISAKPNTAHDEIANFAKTHRESSIITTNYDGCMDEALLRAGMVPRTQIEETVWFNAEDIEKIPVNLIKMHGSINWSYCDSCQEVKEFDLLFLKEAYDKDKLSYPVMGLCKNCGGLSRPLLVPPLSFKILMFPKLIDIWNSAREEIEEAEYLIVVGYSFAEADTYITKIIARSLAMNNNQKMIVVNTDQNLMALLRNRFEAQINGFNSERIIGICESCDTAMEKLLKRFTASKGSKET